MTARRSNAVLLVPRAGSGAVAQLAADSTWTCRIYNADWPVSAIRELAEQQPTPIAAVIDAGAAHAIPLARQIQSAAPLAQLIFVSGPDDESRLEGAMRAFALVDAHWVVLRADHPRLPQQLHEQIAIGSQRQRHRTTLDKVNLQLGAKEAVDARTIQRLVISERFLAAIVEHSADAIITLSPRREILSWNASSEQLVGVSSAAAIGRRFDEFLDGSSCSSFIDAVETVASQRTFLCREFSLLKVDGTLSQVETTISPVLDERRQVLAFSMIARDITERRKLEQQLLRAQRMESIGTLAGGIAHDLNNALTPIMMSIAVLADGEQNHDRQELLATIEASARRGADMVQRLLTFARGVEGRRVGVEVKCLLGDIAQIANDTFLKHIRVCTVVPDDLPMVAGDPTQLHQVFLNLCLNARDAMPIGGTLTLSAQNVMLDKDDASPDTKAGRYVVVTVEDSGTGIPQTIIDRIFDPFFTTKALGQGTGLGLSTSQAIIKNHGGFIQVGSEPGRGSTFKVYLPAPAESRSVSEPHEDTELPHGHGELILVVDDEAAVRGVTQRMLEKFGYRVILASDGSEAVAVYARQKQEIAVVLTDMMMPVMDGAATIERLLAINPRLPIIALSGYAKGLGTAQGRVKQFLQKPYTAHALLGALNEVLQAITPLPTTSEESW
jgi:two-component system cell cycle sensor histidine kinase/response regulator CckA